MEGESSAFALETRTPNYRLARQQQPESSSSLNDRQKRFQCIKTIQECVPGPRLPGPLLSATIKTLMLRIKSQCFSSVVLVLSH